MSKKKQKAVPENVMNNAIAVATNQLLRSGALVLARDYGFTDEQQAAWIEATAKMATDNVNILSSTIKAVNAKVKA